MPLDESFFDLGGHSILATRLVFQLRQKLGVHVPLGLVFDAPTIAQLAAATDQICSGGTDFLIAAPDAAKENVSSGDLDYAKDAQALENELPASFMRAVPAKEPRVVLLTGATGFLGAYILADLLGKRRNHVEKVYVHVRANDADSAQQRLRDALAGRGLWREAWEQEGRVQAVVGDLSKPHLGLNDADWAHLAKEVHVIVHNGALVHWVYPYSKLRAANVLSTMAVMRLANEGRPKSVAFVSSTSALDTEYYIRFSDTSAQGVLESDSLDGSASDLKSGYGQSKWVAERLLMAAASRGLAAVIIRPGYVVGDSKTAVTNTDDFLFRLIKGSAQLGLIPDMNNTINMVPVDHVARVTSLAGLAAIQWPENHQTHAAVFHVTSHPTIRYNEFLGALIEYGWNVRPVEYLEWRTALENHVLASAAAGNTGLDADSNALFPLLHFVLDDLPTSTKSPELNDANTTKLLTEAHELDVVRGVDVPLVGLYLSWLVAVGFLPPPASKSARTLPTLPEGAARQAMGRGSAAV